MVTENMRASLAPCSLVLFVYAGYHVTNVNMAASVPHDSSKYGKTRERAHGRFFLGGVQRSVICPVPWKKETSTKRRHQLLSHGDQIL